MISFPDRSIISLPFFFFFTQPSFSNKSVSCHCNIILCCILCSRTSEIQTHKTQIGHNLSLNFSMTGVAAGVARDLPPYAILVDLSIWITPSPWDSSLVGMRTPAGLPGDLVPWQSLPRNINSSGFQKPTPPTLITSSPDDMVVFFIIIQDCQMRAEY